MLCWETWNNLTSKFPQDKGQRVNTTLEIKKPNFAQKNGNCQSY